MGKYIDNFMCRENGKNICNGETPTERKMGKCINKRQLYKKIGKLMGSEEIENWKIYLKSGICRKNAREELFIYILYMCLYLCVNYFVYSIFIGKIFREFNFLLRSQVLLQEKLLSHKSYNVTNTTKKQLKSHLSGNNLLIIVANPLSTTEGIGTDATRVRFPHFPSI